MRKAGRLDAALADLDRLVALAPDSGTAHGIRGQVLRALGRTDEALVELDRALELDTLSAGPTPSAACSTCRPAAWTRRSPTSTAPSTPIPTVRSSWRHAHEHVSEAASSTGRSPTSGGRASSRPATTRSCRCGRQSWGRRATSRGWRRRRGRSTSMRTSSSTRWRLRPPADRPWTRAQLTPRRT